MRAEAFGYLAVLSLYIIGAIFGALKGWKAYEKRTAAINRLASATEKRVAQESRRSSK